MGGEMEVLPKIILATCCLVPMDTMDPIGMGAK